MRRLFIVLLLLFVAPISSWGAADDYYVNNSVGDDGNACTSEGAGNACETINGALDKADADSEWEGDVIWVQYTGTDYTEDVSVINTPDLNVGTSLQIVGYKTTTGDNPTGDDRPTIDGGGTRTNCVDIDQDGVIVANFICDDPTNGGFQGTAGTAWVNCSATAASAGFYSGTMIASESYSNVDGLDAGRSVDSHIHDNTGQGIDSGGYIWGSIIADNSSTGAEGSTVLHSYQNTYYSNSLDNIYQTGNSDDNSNCFSWNDIFDDGGDDNIDSPGSKCTIIVGYSNFTNAANDNIDASVDYYDFGLTTTAFTFGDAASHDYSISSDIQDTANPMTNIGLHADSESHRDPGAIQHEDSASGGGETSHTFVGN